MPLNDATEEAVITLFTIPKPFVGHTGTIQANAISSWVSLKPSCEVILFGDEEGIAEQAEKFGVRHVPDVERSELGTPLLDGVFRQAQELAAHDIVCYVNADIIMPRTFPAAVERVRLKKYLIVGQRMDLDVDELIDLTSETGQNRLDSLLAEKGTLHEPAGSDYFTFRRGTLGELPSFAVGRPCWDNWMIFRARQLGVPVVDASQSMLVIHQNHDYGHVPGGTGRTYDGPEGQQNMALLGGPERLFTLAEADWVLGRDGAAKRRWSREDFAHRVAIAELLHPSVKTGMNVVRGARRVGRFVRNRVRRLF